MSAKKHREKCVCTNVQHLRLRITSSRLLSITDYGLTSILFSQSAALCSFKNLKDFKCLVYQIDSSVSISAHGIRNYYRRMQICEVFLQSILYITGYKVSAVLFWTIQNFICNITLLFHTLYFLGSKSELSAPLYVSVPMLTRRKILKLCSVFLPVFPEYFFLCSILCWFWFSSD